MRAVSDQLTAAPTFQLLPAIDLRAGRVVRLERGDFAHETAFSDDPAAVVKAFVDGGATWLHVVDLDGARTGTIAHGPLVHRMIARAGRGTSVEIAGGLRTIEGVASVLALGAARVVVGTAALADPSFAGELIERHGAERIAVSLDVRGGEAIGQGWARGAIGLPVLEALGRLLDVGVRWFEVTAIQRDGMLQGPDLGLLELIQQDARARVIAAGGIASPEHLRSVRALGCAGAIVGRALYDGTMSLEAALGALA